MLQIMGLVLSQRPMEGSLIARQQKLRYSMQVIWGAVEKVNGTPLNIAEEPRRAGDPPELVAVADRVRSVLGWTPRYDDLETIVRTSLEWERKIAARDPGAYWPD